LIQNHRSTPIVAGVAVLLATLTGATLSLAFARSGPALLELHGDLEGVHDPALIKAGSTYYLFVTNGSPGNLIPIRCSPDLHEWTLCGHVFDKLPQWATEEIPKARAPWAPDISFYRGRYHLYYAVSSFGSNESAIGLATNATLDPHSPDYKWVDEGMVLRSHKEDDFNAIDPNFVAEDRNRAWLDFGSFWSGIKMRRIDLDTGKLSNQDQTLYSLASRDRTSRAGAPIEAPFIFKHAGYWYLFVSFDFCCRGANSTYNVVVGRSKKITGPYVARDGKPMLQGGGTRIISSTTGPWRGPGHEAVIHDKTGDYLVFHAYSAANGHPFLKISSIAWNDGWPQVGVLQ
jgi:arabinan endo-1,5-alpha-L-arabinosidase